VWHNGSLYFATPEKVGIMLIYIFAILFMLLCGYAAGTIARSKGRSYGIWFGYGIIFNIFAVVIIALLPKGEPAEEFVRQPKPKLPRKSPGNQLKRSIETIKEPPPYSAETKRFIIILVIVTATIMLIINFIIPQNPLPGIV
jgi:hypothetical protein